jgi:signal transduction histidine kinase
MKRRRGLQAKMSASYVLVTAAAVVLVEAALLGVVLPQLESRSGKTSLVQVSAYSYAGLAMKLTAQLGRLPTRSELQLGEPGVRLAPGMAQASADGSGVDIPYTTTSQDTAQPMSMALLVDPGGRVLASSYPARYREGDRLDGPGMGPLPDQVRTQPPAAWGKRGALAAPTPSGEVHWAAAPVFDARALKSAKAGKPTLRDLVAFVYVQVPAAAKLPSPAGLAGAPTRWDSLAPQLWLGLVVLVGAIPVGLVFGLLSTRRLVGRLRRLAATTVAVADGDFRHRVPVSGADEVAQLEHNFNRMAERLSAAMAAERQLAGATERARIARELHDSISQDLFSLRLLAGGLRKALPAGSPLRPQVETMEHTATTTMREMQALLLELRPVALEDTGLIPALEELCQAYRERLGIRVDADLEPVELPPPVEHAVLRVVQEALVNAVKHAHPTEIRLRVHRLDGRVAVAVTDDGGGFDVASAEQRHGLGLGLMRERAAELGGTFQLDSAPGEGTSVRILLPAGQR